MRWWILALVVAVATPVAAQPGNTRAEQRADRAHERRERVKQRIRALRAYTLTEELALDEATAAKLFPTLAKYDEEFDRLLVARVDIQRRLEMVAELKDPRAVDKLIDEAVANQRALWDTEHKRLTQLRKILTPAQTARVLIVLPAMERKIQNQLRKAVERQKPADPAPPPIDPFAQRGRRAAPAAPDDDPGLERVDGPSPPRRNAPPTSRVPANKTCDPFTSIKGCK